MLAERGNEIVKKEVLDRVFKSFQTLIQEILKSSQKSEELMTKCVGFEFIFNLLFFQDKPR